ncbi:uncharacterized protein KY384_001133 [Bacidia gigantensis]|uniref:uncharacterized protein n=1 Tax=Bacidia gigantensis TaxID=2732470 RepID=UPI001D043BB3|nr:uncharacterized protein KY384_001133 [Bacidia gigantensis]KAG8534289.1 hypothetical protein KY384_001133 [Bacidia gigantensis]
MPGSKSKSRYILLGEALGTNHTRNMLGRVVRDKKWPLHHFVPADPDAEDGEGGINPCQILKKISEGSVKSSLKNTMNSYEGSEAKAEMTRLLNLHASNTTHRNAQVTSGTITKYTMTNVNRKLKKLMENDLYCQAIMEELNARPRPQEPLLVVGMLTCEDTKVELGAGRNQAFGGGGGVSGDQTGIPGASAHVAYQNAGGGSGTTTQTLQEEVILALAYDTVKLKRCAKWLCLSHDAEEDKVTTGRKVFGDGPELLGPADDEESSGDDDVSSGDFLICVR